MSATGSSMLTGLSSEFLNASSKRRLLEEQPTATITDTTEIDPASFKNSLWLVKLPRYIAERWSKAENDDILGSFMVGLQQGENGQPPKKKMIVRLTEPVFEGSSADSETFVLEDTNKTNDEDDISPLVLSTNPLGVNGCVTKRLTMRPSGSQAQRSNVARYLAQKLKEKQSQRKTVAVATSQDMQRQINQSHAVPYLTSSSHQEFRRRQIATSVLNAANRVAAGGTTTTNGPAFDKNVLRTRFFEAFEQVEMQSFDSLFQYCASVPGFTREADLRELLDQYARYHRRGKHAHLWELKREYRAHVGELAEGEDVEE